MVTSLQKQRTVWLFLHQQRDLFFSQPQMACPFPFPSSRRSKVLFLGACRCMHCSWSTMADHNAWFDGERIRESSPRSSSMLWFSQRQYTKDNPSSKEGHAGRRASKNYKQACHVWSNSLCHETTNYPLDRKASHASTKVASSHAILRWMIFMTAQGTALLR